MKTIPGLIAVASLATATAFAAVRSQDPAMPQPTEHHKQILAMVGEWEGTVTGFTDGAAGQPSPAKESVAAVGGFWTSSRFECDMMGMPFAGTGVTGYDTTKRRFVGTWVDSMSSFLHVMEGQVDPKTKHLVMKWTGPDMTGAMVAHRMETAHTADAYTSTMYVGEGEGTKVMVIDMKRKK